MGPGNIGSQFRFHIVRYGVALLATLLVTLIISIFSSSIHHITFPLFWGAIAASAWFGGFQSGLAATVLSSVAIYFLSRRGSLHPDLFSIGGIGVLSLVSLVIGGFISAFRRRLDALREREHSFQEIFDGSHDAIFLVSGDARFLEVNPAACELTGYTRQELCEMRIPDLHEAHDLDAYSRFFGSIMAGQAIVSEAQIRRKDGTRVPVEFSNRRFVFRGRPVMHTTARDVTERTRAVDALRQSEARYRAVAETASDAFITIDDQSIIIFVNAAAETIFGYKSDEMQGQSLTMLMPDYLRHLHEAGLASHLASGTKHSSWTGVELSGLHREGHEIPLEVAFSEFFEGGQRRFTGIVRDITRRKEANQAREESEARLRAIVETEPECVKLVGKNGELLEMNPAGLKMLEAESIEDVRNRRIIDFVAPDQRAAFELMAEKVLSGGSETLEFEIVGMKGRRLWVETHSVPLRDQNGEVIARLGITRDITERKRATEKLHARERELAAAQTVAHLGSWEWDVLHNKVTWSDELYRIFGLVPQEFSATYEAYLDRIHPYDQSFVHDVISNALKDKQPFDFDYRVIQPDGKIRTLHARGEVVADGEGRAIKMMGIAQDVTDRKLEAEALRGAEEKYQGIFENASEGIFRSTPDGRFISVNPAMARIYGFESPQQMIMQRTDIARQHYVDPESRAKLRQLLEERDIVERFEAEGYRKNMSRLWTSENVRAVRDPVGDLLYYEGFVEDITARKRDQEALQLSEEYFRSLIEHSTDIITLLDRSGIRKHVSPSVKNVLGFTAGELVGRSGFELLHPDDARDLRALFASRIERPGFASALEYRSRHKDGSWRVLEATAVNLLHNPVVAGVVVSARDITERKHAEKVREQLLKARKQLLRRLVTAQEEERRRIARELHDQLGQQITALMLGLKWLQDSGYCRPEASGHLKQLQEFTDQLGREVHNIAWEVRPTALDDLGLHTALGNYLEKWSERSGKNAEVHINGFNGHRVSPQIETTVYRIIQEALTNVLKHADASGVSLILERRNNHLRAIIEDDGCGFDVDAVMNAPEQERKLGLLGMRERLALVFGTLDIESTPGAGTTLFVSIPTPELEMEDVSE